MTQYLFVLGPNTKPVANAGADQVLTLPVDLVKLDGSKSSDDKGIATYSWTREPTSLAAGVRFGNILFSSLLNLNCKGIYFIDKWAQK